MALNPDVPPLPRLGLRDRVARGIELALLYGGVPVLLARFLPPRGILPALWVIALAVWTGLRRDPLFDRSRLGTWDGWRTEWRPLLLRFLVAALLLMGVLRAYRPDLMFRFPLTRPGHWLLVMVCYPLVSVCPQALLYRVLFEYRYAPLFPSRAARRWVGATLFSLAHLPFGNAVALAFTWVGGFLFLGTYQRTGSVRLSCVEHAFYGNLLFTVGWGFFLYHGGTQALLAN